MKKTVITCKLVNYFLFAGLIVNLFIMVYFKLSLNNHANSTKVIQDEADPAQIEFISLNESKQEEMRVLAESLQMAHLYFYAADLQVIKERTVPVLLKNTSNEVKPIEEWYLGNIPIHNDPILVDLISETIGSTVTIYQKTDLGFVCISSTLNDTNGERYIGNVLPFTSEVGKAVCEGTTFTEIVKTGDEVVHIAYEPIIHEGILIGILSVSVNTDKDSINVGRLS